jgi:hypothetical protein
MFPGMPIPPNLPDVEKISLKETLIVIIPMLLVITVIVTVSNLLMADSKPHMAKLILVACAIVAYPAVTRSIELTTEPKDGRK